MGALRAPEPLSEGHDLSRLGCGKEVLDDWLKHIAPKNEKTGASRTYVVCADEGRVVGYFCLANGSVDREKAPRRLKRQMPDPIPVVLLGRMAVDQDFQGKGIGRGMLRDAFLRARKSAELSGAVALLVHALDDQAKSFYEFHGFLESPFDSHTFMHSLY